MRVCRLILSIYVFLWFNVVVPGHTRGMVTLGGKSASCCAPCCAERLAKQISDKPTPQQQRECAICFVAAIYLPPPVLDIDLQPAERVATNNVSAQAQLLSLDFPTPFWPVGPPSAA